MTRAAEWVDCAVCSGSGYGDSWSGMCDRCGGLGGRWQDFAPCPRGGEIVDYVIGLRSCGECPMREVKP